jgi:hypothetical protein
LSAPRSTPKNLLKRIGKLPPFVLIVCAGILLTLPALLFSVPPLGDDWVIHSLWYTQFSGQLWAGDIYPRWLMDMNAGLGSPAFFYYPPIPYFITSLFRPFFWNDAHGLHQIGASAALSLIISGLCAYLWLRDLSGRGAATVAAVLYMAMPYHLAADLYARCAFAEFWAFAWMPLVLYFTGRAARGEGRAVAGVAVGYALLVMTHLPTTLIFSPVPLCYAAVTAERQKRIKALVVTACGMALGIGLSAVYLLPAMTMQQFVFLDRMKSGYFSYANWLLFSESSMWLRDRPEMFPLVLDMLVVVCLAFFISRSRGETVAARVNRFWLVVAALSVFMMTAASKPVWEVLTILQRVQYTWRFNSLVCVAAAALSAAAVKAVKERGEDFTRGKLKVLLSLAVFCVAVWVPATAWEIYSSLPFRSADGVTVADNNEIISLRRDAPEYRTVWNKSAAALDWNRSADIDSWDEVLNEEFESFLRKAGDAGAGLPRVRVTDGDGDVTVEGWSPGVITLRVRSPKGVSVDVSQFYFPGWKADTPDEDANIAVVPSEPEGFIKLLVPGGEHRIVLRLEPSRSESAGRLISLAALLLTLLLFFLTRRRSYERKQATDAA